MAKIYNEVIAGEVPQALKMTSIKRNGFFVAPSLKVGNTFNDWDEVTCKVIFKRGDEGSVGKEEQKEKK